MTFIEELVDGYWKDFSEKTGITDERTERYFKDILLKASHSSDFIKLCHLDKRRMIARQMGTSGIPKLINKELSKDVGKKQAFLQVLEYVTNLEEEEDIYSKKVLKELKWSMTYGDMLLKVLDFLVCWGKISKVRFCRGRPGHQYKKSKHSCPYASITVDEFGLPINFQCMFNWNEGMIIKGRA